MKIPCEIDNIKTLKKGMKITLNISDEQVRAVMKDIYNFMDMPIEVNIGIDKIKQRQRLNQISEDQRKKIYAIIKDIAASTGNNKDAEKDNLKTLFIQNSQYDDFSLSNCSKELATDFIEFLINFAFEYGIPLSDKPVELIDDTEKYLRACIKHGVCSVCGKEGGAFLGAHGKKISLCEEHLMESNELGAKAFTDKYHVYPVEV